MKLFHKLLLLILLLSVVPLAVVGYQSLTGLQREIHEDVQTMYKEKVLSNRELISRFMGDISERVQQAVSFKKLGGMKPEDIQSFAAELILQHAEMNIVTVLDELGAEVVSAIEAERLSPQGLYEHLQTLDQKKFETHVKQGGTSEVYLVEGEPVVTLYSPYPLEDRPAPGVVAAGVSLKAVVELVKKIEYTKSDEGAALLFDRNGTLLTGKMLGRPLKELRSFETMEMIQQAWKNRDNVKESTQEFVDPFGVEQMGAFAFLDKLDWMLLICEPRDRVFASADLLLWRTVGIILLTILISVMLGLAFARRLVGPIQALVAGAEAIGSGDLDHKIARTTNDEIGILCDAFTQMGGSLKHRETTIERIRTIAGALNTTFEIERVAKVGAEAMTELTECKCLQVFMLEQGVLKPSVLKGEGYTLSVSDGLLERLKGLTAMEVDTSALWQGAGGAVKENLLVPLAFNDPKKGPLVMGALVMGGEKFSNLEQQVVQILSGAMAVSLMNISFLKQSVENERRSHELEVAELVQRTLYPDSDPKYPELEIASFIQSCSETGGDWYGYLKSEDGKTLVVLIGDVTGHGVPAALVTAATNAFFRTMENLLTMQDARPEDLPVFDIYSPKFLLNILNNVILETAHGRLVMTFFAARIHLDTGKMVCANAGHNPPWIYRADPARAAAMAPVSVGGKQIIKLGGGKLKIKLGGAKKAEAPAEAPAEEKAPETAATPAAVEAAPDKPKVKLKIKLGGKKVVGSSDAPAIHWENINARGMRLGETVTTNFEEVTLQLYRDDILCFYTDGFIENTSPANEEFGKKRMRAALEEGFAGGMQATIESLKKRSYEFYQDHPRGDDLTLIMARVLADWENTPAEVDEASKEEAAPVEA